MMPQMSGLEVLAHLRQVYLAADLPIIMATALDASADVIRAFELGANDYVTKPIDFPVLLARIRAQLELKASVNKIRRLEVHLAEQNQQLRIANATNSQLLHQLEGELAAAAEVQRTLLPGPDLPVSGWRFAWAFHPSRHLGGDHLNILPLSAKLVALFVLDVSGHGVAPALQVMLLDRLLSPPADPNSILTRRGYTGEVIPLPPAQVAAELNRLCPADEVTGQYFTLCYGLLHRTRRTFRYVCAGHPGPLVVSGDAVLQPPFEPGFPIGIIPGAEYAEQELQLAPGDRLLLYSDGLTEAGAMLGNPFGIERTADILRQEVQHTLTTAVDHMVQAVHDWCAGQPEDDLSLLLVEPY